MYVLNVHLDISFAQQYMHFLLYFRSFPILKKAGNSLQTWYKQANEWCENDAHCSSLARPWMITYQ